MISKRRKLPFSVLVASALCVLAFAAIPAPASAAALTNPTKALVAIGTRIRLLSTNAKIEIPAWGTETCEHWEFVGFVKENTGTVVRVVGGSGEDKTEGCRSGETKIETELETIELTPTKKQLAFTFTEIGGIQESSTSTVTYVGPKATRIHVEGPFTGTFSGTFSGDFTIYNPKGEVILVD